MAAWGVLAVLTGAITLWALMLIAFGTSGWERDASMHLGLALPLVLSAVGQLLLSIGGALLVSAWRRR